MRRAAHAGQWFIALQVLAVAGLSAAVIFSYRNPTMNVDEAFHLLSARSINAGEGLPDVGGGRPYVRAWGFSYLVALATRLGGDTLTVARLPAAIAAVILVATLWLWVRWVADGLAAWLASLLLAGSVFTLDIAQFCRFYSFHALAVFVLCACAYAATNTGASRTQRIGWCVGAMLSVIVAWHLQRSTAVILLGLAVWGWLWLVSDAIGSRVLTSRERSVRLLVLIVGPCLAGGAAFYAAGGVGWALGQLTWAPYWTSAQGAGLAYYHRDLLNWYTALWSLFPLGLLGAIAVYRRPAVFAATVFVVGFAVMSVGSAHAPRYLFMVMPMFFALWGMALSALVQGVYGRLTGIADGAPVWTRRVWSGAVAVLLGLGLLYASNHAPAYRGTRVALATPGPNALFQSGDYDAMLDALRRVSPQTLDVPLVLAAPSTKARYYLPGRRVVLVGHPDQPDSQRCISDPAALRQALSGTDAALIVVDQAYWRDPRFVRDELADVIESMAQQVPMPDRANVRVYRWDPLLLAHDSGQP